VKINKVLSFFFFFFVQFFNFHFDDPFFPKKKKVYILKKKSWQEVLYKIFTQLALLATKQNKLAEQIECTFLFY